MNGVSRDTIESLSLEEAADIWKLYLLGAWGNAGIIGGLYNNFCMAFSDTQTFISANSKSKYKPKKPPQFKDYTPGMHQIVTGEDPSASQDASIQSQVLSMFTKEA